MQRISPEVYDKLFVHPFKEFRKGGKDSLGDAEAALLHEFRAYIHSDLQEFKDENGNLRISNMQIYLRGEDAVQISADSVITCGEAVKMPILHRQLYYGAAGACVIGVLYLP